MNEITVSMDINEGWEALEFLSMYSSESAIRLRAKIEKAIKDKLFELEYEKKRV